MINILFRFYLFDFPVKDSNPFTNVLAGQTKDNFSSCYLFIQYDDTKNDKQ